MRSQTVTTSGTSISTIVCFDTYRNPFNVSIATEVTGTATYTVQHTFDDVVTSDPSTAVWFDSDDTSMVASTTNANSNFIAPVLAARLNQTGGNGSIRCIFTQSGLLGG